MVVGDRPEETTADGAGDPDLFSLPPAHVGSGVEALMALLDSTAAPVVATDATGRIGYANERAAALFGYTVAELCQLVVEDLVPEVHRHRHVRRREAFQAAPDTRILVGEGHRQLYGRHRDGHVIPVDVTLTPMQARVSGLWVVASIRDATGRREREQRMRTLTRAYRTLAQITQVTLRATDVSSLYQETCRVAVQQGGYLGAWVAVARGDRVVPAASAGALEGYIRQLHITLDAGDERGHGPTATAMREGRPTFSTHFLDDDRTRPWHGLAQRYGIAASATIPVRVRHEVVASINLYSSEVGAFEDQMPEVLDRMADNVGYALERLDADQRLRDLAQERTDLAARLVHAQEEERRRIAAGLHDDPLQGLAALDLRLGLLARQVEDADPSALQAVDEVHQTLARVTAQLRELLVEIEPSPPGPSLMELTRDSAARVLDGSGIAWSVERGPENPARTTSLEPWVRAQALRIVREALVNARTYAGASEVRIFFQPHADSVEITVTDDGHAWPDLRSSRPPGQVRLSSMSDRATILGGWCRLESRPPPGPGAEPPRGAVVRLHLPLAGARPTSPT